MIGQGAAAFIALICLWWVCRKTTDLWLPVATMVTAGLLIMPHVYGYDLVLLLVPLLALARYCQSRGWTSFDIGLFAALYTVPGFITPLHQQLPLPVVPLLLLALLLRLALLSESQDEHED
jgi:hypothetical protein